MEYIKEEQFLLHEELCKFSTLGLTLTPEFVRFKENIRLAAHIANEFSTPHDSAVSREDILQEAYLGLWKACILFEESRGFQFSTFAVPYIRGGILRFLRDSESLKTPRSFKDIRSSLHSHGFTLPLDEEEVDVLLSEGKFSRAQLAEFMEFKLVSLDAPAFSDSEGTTYSEVIPDKSIVEYDFDEEELESIINKILEYIKPAHRDLVEEWMYATLEGCWLRQETLAVKYSLSQPTVGRILRAAIEIFQLHSDEIRELFGL